VSALRASLPAQLLKLGIDTGGVAYRTHDAIRHTTGPASLRSMPSVVVRRAALFTWAPWDTLIGGIQLETDNPGGYCTLGIVADRGAVRGLVTASHCSTNQWNIDYSGASQPTPARPVATEHTDPTGWACGFLNLRECRGSDASFYSIASEIQSHRGLIAQTQSSAGPGAGNGTRAIDGNRPYFIVDAVDNNDSYSGQYVHKVGNTSGWTWGQLTNTCVDHLNNNNAPGDILVTTCTYEATYTNVDGDSGGPVFTFYGDGYNQSADIVKLLGINLGNLAGGDAVFSKWGRVAADLGSLNPIRGATLSPPSVSGGMIFTAATMSWPAVSGATKYNVFRVRLGVTEIVASTTSTSFADGSSNMLEFTGTSPAPGWPNNVQYYVYAVNPTSLSPKSTPIWYRSASGTFTVNINGPSVVGPFSFQCSVWNAQVGGAATITSYEWSGLFAGSESSVQGTVPQTGGELHLVVQDSQGRQGGYIMQIAYDPNNTDYCI
jgi:hypothetical protein